MIALAVVVFFALQRVTAGYGMMYTKKWGPVIGNRLGWIIMEAPSFIAMLMFWLSSPRAAQPALVVMASLFEIHYFQRSFIFPFLIRGKGHMPVAIIIMGILFNIINAYMIGGWLSYVSPTGRPPPLHTAGRDVPVRDIGKLSGRIYRVDRFRHTYMEPGRAGLRHMDLRQSRAPSPLDTL